MSTAAHVLAVVADSVSLPAAVIGALLGYAWSVTRPPADPQADPLPTATSQGNTSSRPDQASPHVVGTKPWRVSRRSPLNVRRGRVSRKSAA